MSFKNMFLKGFGVRSAKLGQGRESKSVTSRRPEGCRSSEFHEIVVFFPALSIEIRPGT